MAGYSIYGESLDSSQAGPTIVPIERLRLT